MPFVIRWSHAGHDHDGICIEANERESKQTCSQAAGSDYDRLVEGGSQRDGSDCSTCGTSRVGEETHMRNWRRHAISASAAAAVIAALQIGATPASSQGDVYKAPRTAEDRKSTRLNSSHANISYA